MSDVNANIGINIDASPALAELKNLQRQLATFHSQVAKGSASAAIAQKNLQTNLLNAVNATGKFQAQMGLVRTSTESFTNALESNKLSMGQYFKYAGASTKTFGRLFKSEFDTIGKVAEDRVKKMQTQYIKMGRDATGATKAMAITPLSLNMQDAATKTALASQKQAIFNQLVRQGSTSLLNFGKNTQWAGRQLMVGFTVPLAYFGTVAAKTFMDLEMQAIRFKRVYGDIFTTEEQTTKALKDIENLAKEFTKYGVAVTDTMKMAADAAATGKMGADLTAQVAEATRLAVLGGVEQEQALETTISLQNAFGISADNLKKKIDFLNAVENQTVVNIEDLTIAIPKAGPVVKQLGGDVEDLAFFLTAMKEGGINASEGANALKSGLASLINPTKKASQMLMDMGVNIKSIVEGNQGNLKEIVIDFSQALNQLDPLTRARAIEQLFGKFQFARLSTLFQNVTQEGTQASRVLDLTGKSIEELAILSERELKTVEDAVGTNFRSAVEQLKLSIAPIGKTFLEAVTPIVKTLGDLFERFNNLSDGTKKFLVIMTTLVGVIGPALLMTFGLLANGTANIIKLFLGLRTGFLKLTGDSKTLGATTNYLTAEQLEAETVAASLNQAHTRLTQQFQLETAAVAALRNAYVQATVAAANFAKANPGMMAPRQSKPKKFAKGSTYVPGTGNKDTVPSILTPGEAVIPRDVAQDPKFQPIIDAMVSGRLQGFEEGTRNAQPFANSPQFQPKIDLSTPSTSPRGTIGGYRVLPQLTPEEIQARNERALAQISRSRAAREENIDVDKKSPKKVKARAGEQYSHVGKSKYVPIAQILATPGLPQADIDRLTVYRDILRANDQPEVISTRHNLAYSFPGADNRRMAGTGLPIEEWAKKWQGAGAGKWISSNIPASQAMLVDDAILNKIIESGATTVNDDIIEKAFKDLPDDVKKTSTYQKMDRLYSSTGEYTIGKGLGDTPETTRAVLEQAKKQGLIQGYEVRERFSNSKGKVVNSGITIISKDGQSVDIGRGSSGQRNPIKTSQDKQRRNVLVQPSGETEVDPKTGKRRKITAANTKPKKAGTKRNGGNSKDTRVVSVRGRKVILPGAAFGMDANGNPIPGPATGVRNIPFSDVTEQTRLKQSTIKQAEAIEEQTKAVTESTKSTKNLSAKFTGTANVFAGLTMLGSFMGGTIGDLSQKLAPFAFGIAAIAQLLPALKSGFIKLGAALVANPYVAALAALAAVALAWKILDSRARKMAEAQSKYIDTVSATTEKMKKVGELTGKVGASELMARRREGGNADTFTTGFDRAGQQFGTNFLESQIGKEILNTFKTGLTQGGTDAVKNIALELSTYVADGLMKAEDANSIAQAIGINMSDMTIASNISGQLREIIGPDGQDLLTQPLVVRLKIADESAANISQAFEAYQSTNPGTSSKESKNAAAAIAASGAQSLEIIQAQRDGQNKLYDDQIRALQTQLASTVDKKKQKDLEAEISTLKKNQLSDDEKIAARRKAALDVQLKGLAAIRSREKLSFDKPDQAAFFASLKQQVKDKFKSDPLTAVFLDKAAGTKRLSLEVAITTMVGAGDLTPNTATKLITMFGKGREEQLETLLTTTFAVQDPGKVQSLINLATNIKGKGGNEIGFKLLTEIGAEGQEAKFDDRLSALTLLQKIDGKEINLGLFLKGDGLEKLDKLVPLFNKVEGIKSSITKEVLIQFQGENKLPQLQALVDNWEYYVNLPEETKKTAIQTFLSINKVVGDPTKSEDLTNNIFPRVLPPNTIPGGSGTNNNGGEKRQRDTTYDDILTSLKRTKDATINVTKGAQELMRVLGGNKDLKFFKGIDQQLSAIGANTDFIDFVGGVEKAVQDKIIKVNKKGVVSLTEFGKAVRKAYDEKQLGSFSARSATLIKDLQGQRKGFIALKAAGASSADALRMVEDADFAVSLSKAKTSAEVKKLIKNFQDERKEIEKTLRANDPQAFLRNQMDIIDQKLELDERVARRKYERDTKAAEDQIDLNNKVVREAERTLQTDEKIGDRKVEIINDQISALQRRISVEIDSQQNTLDAESRQLSEDSAVISNTVDAINKKYDQQEQALNKIYEINQDIAEQEKEKLGLADAITRGDISAAAVAAQEIRSRNTERSGELAQEMLVKARESEIAGVRGTRTGKNADEIAARQYQIERLSFGLNASRLAIEKDIAIKQEEIYQIEVKRKDIYALIRKTQDDSYNQNLIIEKAQEALDKELDIVDLQRDRMTDLQLGIDKATQEGVEFTAELNAAYKVIDNVSGLWNGLTDKNLKVTIQTIEETIKTSGSSTGSTTTYNQQREAQIKAAAQPSATPVNRGPGYRGSVAGLAMGGMVTKYFASGGFARGTDTIPAMLTPGEFVVNRAATKAFGPALAKINDSKYPSMLSDANLETPTYVTALSNVIAPNNVSSSNYTNNNSSAVYNYNVGITVSGSNSNANDIAKSVVKQIKSIDSQRIGGQRA